MRKYLFYATQLYCLSIFRPLQAAIRAAGDEAAWYFVPGHPGFAELNADETLLRSVADVKTYNPAAVFSPVTLVPDFFPGLKVQLFHGLATDDTGKKGHFRVRGLYDLYCTRNQPETAFFSAAAQQDPHFAVVETGWTKLDPLFAGDAVNDLRSQLATDKPIVFYAATFSPSLTSAPALVDTIGKLSATGKYHWIVTLHPKCPPDVQARYQALQGDHLTFYPSSQDVLPLMQTADVMLCDTSSIALEYLLLEKPLVTFRTKKPAPYLLNVTEPDDIEAALARALTRPADLLAEIRRFSAELHPHRDGRSSERVLAAVAAMLAGGMLELKSKPMNILRKIRLRKQLHYYRPW